MSSRVANSMRGLLHGRLDTERQKYPKILDGELWKAPLDFTPEKMSALQEALESGTSQYEPRWPGGSWKESAALNFFGLRLGMVFKLHGGRRLKKGGDEQEYRLIIVEPPMSRQPGKVQVLFAPVMAQYDRCRGMLSPLALSLKEECGQLGLVLSGDSDPDGETFTARIELRAGSVIDVRKFMMLFEYIGPGNVGDAVSSDMHDGA